MRTKASSYPYPAPEPKPSKNNWTNKQKQGKQRHERHLRTLIQKPDKQANKTIESNDMNAMALPFKTNKQTNDMDARTLPSSQNK